jgi:hypothetical protein
VPFFLERRKTDKMKRIISFFLELVTCVCLFGTVGFAGPLDDNGDTGGDDPGGTGLYVELWDDRWCGMRITVVDITDPARESGGEQRGKVAAGTKSIDITGMSSTDSYFTRILAGDNTTPLTYGNKVTHFGNTSKMAYRDGEALTSTMADYDFYTVEDCPYILGELAASPQAIKDFINNKSMLTKIADWCGGGLTYETLTGGDYKMLVEPILYCLIEGSKFAFTATEAAMFRPHGNNTGWTLINNTLANAFFLEYDELGWDAWHGAANVNQKFADIIEYLGMHIYSITPENPPDDPPPDDPPDPPEPPPPPSLSEGELNIVKVEYGTADTLDGAEFEITRTSHWERRLVDPDEDDTENPNPNAEDYDDVWEWLEVHEIEYVGTYITDGGTVTLDLEPGSFTVREVTPPAGYILDANNVKTIDIPREGGSYSPTLTFENKKLPGLVVKKYDEDTGLPLAGAEFSVARKGGSVVYEGVTPANGAITVTDLPEGWYTVTEIAAPGGYLKRDENKDVFLPAGETIEIKFDNRRRPTLEIIKLDAQTKQPLSGAKFRVWKTEGGTVGEFTTGNDGKITIPNLDEAIYSAEEISAPEGYLLAPQHKDIQLEWGKVQTLVFTNAKKPGLTITKFDEATGEALAGAEFSVAHKGGAVVYEGQTDANGKIHLSGLAEGWYTIKETAAPFGYLIVNKAKDVYLEGDSIVDVRFANRRRPALEIIKIDAETKQPLAGAKFRVWETESLTVAEYTTDANGRILIPNLDEKIYSVEEIIAPEGYVLETQHKDIRLEWGRTKTLTYTNHKKPALTIRKYDELTNEPLAGASFRLWYTEGDTWGETQVTDQNGVIAWTDLDPGIYSIQEIDEPYGYFRDPARKEILLNGGDNKQLEFFNRPRPVLTILKRDKVTEKPLEGVKFKVQRLEGETIGEFLTDSSGKIELSPKTGYLLDEQIYRVTEIAPSEEYLLDPENVKDVLLKWHEPTELVFENLLKPTLIFIKTNALTGRGISGATYKIEYEGANGGVVSLGSVKTKCGLIVLPHVQPGWYILTETAPAPGYSLPTNPVQRIYLSPGENSYTYEQTKTELYADPRTNPNNGASGKCNEWCGYLCGQLCAGNCGNAGGGSMSPGNGGGFGNITITNGKGEPIGTVTTPANPTPNPNPTPATPDPEPKPESPPASGGGIVYINPDFPGITITFGSK